MFIPLFLTHQDYHGQKDTAKEKNAPKLRFTGGIDDDATVRANKYTVKMTAVGTEFAQAECPLKTTFAQAECPVSGIKEFPVLASWADLTLPGEARNHLAKHMNAQVKAMHKLKRSNHL